MGMQVTQKRTSKVLSCQKGELLLSSALTWVEVGLFMEVGLLVQMDALMEVRTLEQVSLVQGVSPQRAHPAVAQNGLTWSLADSVYTQTDGCSCHDGRLHTRIYARTYTCLIRGVKHFSGRQKNKKQV